MIRYLSKIAFYDHRYPSGGGSDYPNYCVGDKGVAVIEIGLKWGTYAKNFFYVGDGMEGGEVDRSDTNGSFINDGFRIGDTIHMVSDVSGNTGDWIISDLTYNKMTLVGGTGLTDMSEGGETGYIYGTTWPNCLEFFHNVIDNNGAKSYISLVDNQSTQHWQADLDPTGGDSEMVVYSNSAGWVTSDTDIGEMSPPVIEYLGLAAFYERQYRIIHRFIWTPMYLVGDLKNILNRMPPASSYYRDVHALKYICDINLKFDKDDPNIIHTTRDNDYVHSLGKTSWYNETMAGGVVPSYSAELVTYKDSTDSTTVQSAYIDSDCYIHFSLFSENDKFSDPAGDDPLAPIIFVHFMLLPQTEVYVDTTSRFDEAFFHEICFVNDFDTPHQGQYDGSYLSMLADVTATFVNTGQIDIVAKIKANDVLRDRLKVLSPGDRYFMVATTTQDPSKTDTKGHDRTISIVDARAYLYNQDNPNLISGALNLFDSLYDGAVDAFTSINALVGDIYLARTKFRINTEIKGKVKKITVKVECENNVQGKKFPLEEYVIDCSSMPVSRGVQQLSYDQSKGQRMSSSNDYNDILLQRIPAYDDGLNLGYGLKYPLVIRWETWIQPEGIDDDFFNMGQLWSNYPDPDMVDEGWQLNYNVYIDASGEDDNNYVTTTKVTSPILITSDDDQEFTEDYIGSVNTGSTDDLRDFAGGLSREENTKVTLVVEGNFLGKDPWAYLRIDAKNTGGEFFAHLVHSDTDLQMDDGQQQVWIESTKTFAITGGNKVLTFTCVIDYLTLNELIDTYYIRFRMNFK